MTKNKLTIALISLCVVLALTGCASSNLGAPPVPMAGTASLKGARLAVVVPESPGFLARTPPDWQWGLFGAIGGAARAGAQISEGERLAKQFAITDPALTIGKGLAARLRTTYGMAEGPASVTPAAERVDTVIAAAPQVDLILDVRSQVFGFNYLPKEPTKFFVMSTSWARLVDVKTRRVLAEARCIPTSAPPTTSFENLLGNNAEAIKTGLAAYVEPCIEQLAAKMKL